MRALQPRAGQVEQRHPLRVRLRGEVPAGEPRLDGVLPGLQPVHRRVHVVGRRRLDAEVGAECRVGPPGEGGQFRSRVRDAGDDQGEREVALRAGRAEQPREPQFRGHRPGGGDVAVRQRPGDRDRRRGALRGGEGIALERGLDRVHDVLGELRQVRERLVADFPVLAVGAAQQPGLVLPAPPLLVGVRALDPGHVHRCRLLQHDRILTACSQETVATRQDFPGYTLRLPGGSRAWSGTRFLLGDPVTSA